MNHLLLRYSSKQGREKNIGLFRLSLGLGSLIAPAFGALCYVIGGYLTCFMTLAIFFTLLAPYIYYRLNSAFNEWQ